MPQFPKNELAQTVIATCVANGIQHVVISPGSRNAPLTIGFSNHPDVNVYSIVDERSASFFALGMAQQLRAPVAIVCTSGSALLNYYPAITEAFYSNISLVAISADRPKKYIDIGDGQTIRQEQVFEKHILSSLNLTEHVEAGTVGMLNRILKKGFQGKGPVHINVPFDEPLYEVSNEIIELPKSDPIEKHDDSIDGLEAYAELWNASTKKIIIVGEHFPDEILQKNLEAFINDPSVLILIENTANVAHPRFINSIDKLIFPLGEEDLEKFQPDILLSLGGLIVSKKIKQHLRKFRPKHHWHVDPKRAFDTFLCLEHHFKINAANFFEQFIGLTTPVASTFQDFWMRKKAFRLQQHHSYIEKCQFSDLKVFDTVLSKIPDNSQLQVSNSSVIRYTQLFDINTSLQVFCNRGTSGIDGSTSTAIGAAVASDRETVFITGDISFFYDSNALWNNHIPTSFRIILINNGGGAIFRFIPGPKESNALDYFETPHNLTAEHLCNMFNFEYYNAKNELELGQQIDQFFDESEHPRLLEVFTPQEENDMVLKSYFKNLKE